MAAQILIVEDENIVAKYVEHLLMRSGYMVSGIASSGEEALKKIAETRPDLVLMDIVLKGEIDGITAAEQIRHQFKIPVVYLTALDDQQTLERAKITEPYGYLLKPFQARELITTLEMALYKHQMERKLAESEQWLSTTLNSLSDAVIATDTEGRLMYLNPVAEGLTGWKLKEAMGRALADVFQLVNTRTLARLDNPLINIAGGGLTNQMLLAKDGRTTPIDASAAPIKDGQGGSLGIVLAFRDITERKQAEAERAKLIFELQDALGKIKTLSGLIPLCSSCKKIRDEQGLWHHIDVYLQQHFDAHFAYGTCPECVKKRHTERLGGDI